MDDSLLPHLSPLGWEHINLTGNYSWQQNKQVEQGSFWLLPGRPRPCWPLSDFRPLPPLNRP